MSVRGIGGFVAYLTALAAAIYAAIYGANLLPGASSGTCLVAGWTTAFLAWIWLPCPCHRKDGQ